MVGALAIVPTSAAGTDFIGTICAPEEGAKMVKYRVASSGIEDFSVSFTQPGTVGLLQAATEFTPYQGVMALPNVPAIVAEPGSLSVVLAGTGAAALPVNAGMAFQMITGATPSPSDFGQDADNLAASNYTISWEMCTDECCVGGDEDPSTDDTDTDEIQCGCRLCPDCGGLIRLGRDCQGELDECPDVPWCDCVETTDDTSGPDATGIALALIPTAIAGAAALVVSRKRK